VGGGDIVEDDLVGPLPIVEGRELDGIPGVPQVLELRPLDDPTRIDIQTRYDANLKHWSLRSLGEWGVGSREQGF
jgi:hypothetical protein